MWSVQILLCSYLVRELEFKGCLRASTIINYKISTTTHVCFFPICIQTENNYYFISDQHVVIVMREVHADKQCWTVCSSLPAPRASPQRGEAGGGLQRSCFEAFPCIHSFHSFACATHVVRTQSWWHIGKTCPLTLIRAMEWLCCLKHNGSMEGLV